MDYEQFKTIAINTLCSFIEEENLVDIKDNEELTNMEIDSMQIMTFLTTLETKLEKNLDIEKFENYGFILSLETIYKVFFIDFNK
jgi:acyl carrier protein